MKNIIKLLVLLTSITVSFSSCDSASASDGTSTTSDSTALFRFTRTAFPTGSTITDLDAQCKTEFGSQYMTSTYEEARSLARLVNLEQSGAYTYIFNKDTGNYQPNCNSIYCTVLCIKK